MAGAAEHGGVTLYSLPLFVRLAGRPVILIGDADRADGGEAAAAKRRLLDRAGAKVVGEAAGAALAIVAVEDDAIAEAAVARLRARGVLVNAVDRPGLCDFTLPAIVDRAPVLVAIGTGGVSAGLAAALRQRLEALLPADLGRVADRLHAGRADLRARFPDGAVRRRAIAAMLAKGGELDLLGSASIAGPHRVQAEDAGETQAIVLASPDPDDLTLRQARWLANADRVIHDTAVPTAILARARADAERLAAPAPAAPRGLTVIVSLA